MTKKTCIICIGSNFNPYINIQKAVIRISDLFPDTLWGKTVITIPEGSDNNALTPKYHNIAASFTTSMNLESIKTVFKEIEKACGRTPSSKTTGLIPLDIDVLIYDNKVIKPKDLESGYVTQALSLLKY